MKISALDFSRRAEEPELMDDPHCDLRQLERTYAQFQTVNALVSGWALIYRWYVRPRLRRNRPSSVLDVGCGGGDLARSLVNWARRDGFSLRVLGIDTDERAIAYASRRPYSGIHFRAVDSHALLSEGAQFDLVVSNHVLHHLSDTEVQALMRDSQALCQGTVLHNDIERHPLAYPGFAALAGPFFRDSFIVPDGLLSVRRSFTPAELRALRLPGWQVRQPFPFRLLLTYEANYA